MKNLTKAQKRRLAKKCYTAINNLCGKLEDYLDADIRIHGIKRLSFEIDEEWFFFDDLFGETAVSHETKCSEPVITNDEWVSKVLNGRT